VDLAALAGTGASGAIRVEDVEAAARAPRAERAPDRAEAMREGMARAMARSKREIPHYYLTADVDLTPALEWLQGVNAARALAERILPAALVLKAVAAATSEVPEVNGFFVDGAFRPSAAVHLGVAISLRGGGLIAPALLDVGAKPLATVMDELRDLVERARQGRLRGREVTDPTLTVTNLGDQGVTSVLGVIYPPQVALVGLGRIERRPRVVGDAVAPRSVVTLSLAADHRVSDGHRGGRFLAAVARRLAHPEDP
ncbi:MAG: 2-oxo acid dehydrogenase subunit E2, partial [Planctomycetes bacterium]|nr:2-oxo acid dehydrogenase subunit E2 [Planctomycetota bacterium]